jgi:polygalacturonase
MNYSPLIYAYQKKNIAITGKGILNGQGNNENCGHGKEVLQKVTNMATLKEILLNKI